MREILFRAWHHASKEMYEVLNINIKHGTVTLDGGICALVTAKDNVVIEQFTGLLDKNGNKIFEGDVVKSDIGLVGEIQFMPEHCACMVKFRSKGNLCYEYLNDELASKYIEVISNIHEEVTL